MNSKHAKDAFATLAVAMADQMDTSGQENAKDRANGAEYIPSEVTSERRKGHLVKFEQESADPASWYWFLARKDELIPYLDLSEAAEIQGDDWDKVLGLSWEPRQLEVLKIIQQRSDHTLTDSDIEPWGYEDEAGFFAQWLNGVFHSNKLDYRFTNGYEKVNNGPHKLVKISPLRPQ